jgi:4-hydroxy-2-oxoglutarate aldolase
VKLDGIFLPVTTPFEPETASLSAAAFAENLGRWLAHPIRGIVVGGSTGEAPLLDLEEICALVEWARAILPEDVLLLAGTGMESTRHTSRACLAAAERGADAVLVRPPAYYREQMTPEAIRAHFLEVADRSPVPLILYHVPKFVPVELAPELAARLVEHENIIGIKDSSGDLKNLGALGEACAGRAAVLVGSGAHLYAGLEIGATGGILAVGLLATERCCHVFDAWRSGRTMAAGAAQEALGPLHRTVVVSAGVPGVKHALDLLGLCGGPLRAPLRPPGARTRARVEAALVRAGLLETAVAAGGDDVH